MQSLSSRPGRSLSSAFKAGEVNKKLVSRAAPNNRAQIYKEYIYIYTHIYYIYIFCIHKFHWRAQSELAQASNVQVVHCHTSNVDEVTLPMKLGWSLDRTSWRGSRGPVDHEKVLPYDLNRFDLVIVRRSQAADELSCSSDQPWPLFSWTSLWVLPQGYPKKQSSFLLSAEKRVD